MKGSQMSGGTLLAGTALLLMAVLTSKAFEMEDIVPGHQVAAQIGENLELRCRTTGCDHPTFSWRTQLDFPLGAEVSHQGSSSVLKMKVGFENEHEYLCNARCGEIRKQQRVQIDIYSFPSDPVIEISHPLVLGKPATVTCHVAKVYPADRLQIYLEIEGEVRQMAEFSREPLNKLLETKSASMTFTPSEEHIGRNITCRAELPIDEMKFEPKEREATQILHVNFLPPTTPELSPTPELSSSTPERSPSTPEFSPSTPELSQSTPELSPSTPELSPSTPESSPSTPELTEQTEAVTEFEDFTIKSASYNTQHQVTDSKKDYPENETSPNPNARIFTTYTMNVVGNGTEEVKIVIAKLEEPDYVTPVVIAVSSLATAAGPMAAILIYVFRKAKINGSYSLVNSLKPNV